MNIFICKDAVELGKKAAELAAACINESIGEKGAARIVLSTGNSQFETIRHLIALPVDWSRVTMFHLDEYVGIENPTPPAFRST